MAEIIDLGSKDRPREVILITSIHKAINEISVNEMTLAEILGCLEIVSKDVYA